MKFEITGAGLESNLIVPHRDDSMAIKVITVRSIITLLVLFSWGAVAATANDMAFVEKPATPALLKELKGGGFVIYIRHGITDNSRPDQVPRVDLDDCSTQRPLADEGRKQMVEVGNAIRKAGIPVGEVLVSPMCRARESAQAAFGPNYRTELLLMYSSNFTTDEKAPSLSFLRAQLARPMAQGNNRVLVAHAPNLMDLIGYFPREASVVIFRPLGERGFEYLASITPEQWPELLKQVPR